MTVWSVTKNLPTIDDNWIPYFEKIKSYWVLIPTMCWPVLFEIFILICGKLFSKYYIDDYNLI